MHSLAEICQLVLHTLASIVDWVRNCRGRRRGRAARGLPNSVQWILCHWHQGVAVAFERLLKIALRLKKSRVRLETR